MNLRTPFPLQAAAIPQQQHLESRHLLDEDSKNFALSVAEVLDETKVQELVVLHVAPLLSWTSFMVFGTVQFGSHIAT